MATSPGVAEHVSDSYVGHRPIPAARPGPDGFAGRIKGLKAALDRDQRSGLQRRHFEAVQTGARVNVTCVTPLGEEVASIW
jgi:hypothetical protein